MDVFTFGETMTLFNATSLGPLRYANHFEKTIGGAESNVAIGLARLGHEVSWFSRLGSDEFGLYVRNFIRGEGVDTSRVIFDDLYPTAVFFKERQTSHESNVYYYRSNSAARHIGPEDIDEQWIASAKYLHLTGITPALSKSCEAAVHHAIDIAQRNGVTVVFDPNLRLKLWTQQEAKKALQSLARRADIVLPGFDEGQLLTNETTPETIADHLLEWGVKGVSIKLGEKGAYFATRETHGYVPSHPIERVVDPIGAGDAFAAGFLSGRLRNWSYEDSTRLATLVASYALTTPGDIEGLPFWSQLQDKEKTNHVFR